MNKHMDKQINIGTWVLVHWISDNGMDDIIHPDDLELVKTILPYGATVPSTSIGKVVDFKDEYAIINYSGKIIRVIPTINITKPVPYNGDLEVGNLVSIVDKDYIGEVIGVSWHYKERKAIYTLKVDGKRKSKRYWPEELNHKVIG